MHVDICRAEVLDAFNWMNLLSGPVIALCANSSVYGGQYLCGREAFLRDLGERRDGITPRMFGTLEEVLRYLSSFDCYLLPDREGYRRVEQPFIQFAEGKLGSQREGLTEIYEAFLWHEHYVWSAARVRVAHSTVEVRSACQQRRHGMTRLLDQLRIVPDHRWG